MTRKFVHLTLLISALFLTSCSVFDAEETTAIDEIEGESENIGDDSEDLGEEELASDDMEDLDVESAEAGTAATATSDGDSFGDIEDFNEGLIGNELSGEEELSAGKEAPIAGGTSTMMEESDDLDLETAEVEEAPAVVATAEPVAESSVVEVDNKITNLEYKSQEAGGTVVISAQKPVVFQVRDEPEFNQTIVEVADVQLPERFKLPYIAKDFGQAIATVNAYQDAGSTTARFVIQYKSKVRAKVEQSGNSVLVMNATGSASDDDFVASAASTDSSGATTISAGSGKTSVAGKKISVEMYGVDIKQFIQTVADEVGVNIIIDNSATGTVNVKMRNVEWEELLSTVLNAHGLTYERKGQILRIAQVETITKELVSAQDRLRAEAAADLLTQPRIMKIIPVNYGEVESLVAQITPLLTDKERVTADKRSSSLVITGYPDTIKRTEALVASLDIQPLQVMIEGKIIEASDEFGKEFGITWNSTTTFDVAGNDARLGSTIRGTTSPATALGGYIGDISVGSIDLLGDLTALLSIFEREQKIKILSSPKVLAVNKERAVISQTQQVPIFQSIAVANAGTQNSVTFQDAILSLEVTPQISFNSDMVLDIKVTRDIPGAPVSGGSVAINKRSAQTKIIVKDGQSAVLGGIFSMDEREFEIGVPLLKDIPILGYLFKNTTKQLTKNELVIFLSPKILNPDSKLQAKELSRGNARPGSSGTESQDDAELDNLESEMETL